MVTVKRNGVFISFPEFERKNGDVRDDVISGARVNKSINLDIPMRRSRLSSVA